MTRTETAVANLDQSISRMVTRQEARAVAKLAEAGRTFADALAVARAFGVDTGAALLVAGYSRGCLRQMLIRAL
jgi:hypothetical protein